MDDFVYLARIVKDAIQSGAWPMMLVIYGGSLFVGIIIGKIAFAIGRWVGFAAAAGVLVYLYQIAVETGGVVVPVAHPLSWWAWGIVFVAGRRVLTTYQ